MMQCMNLPRRVKAGLDPAADLVLFKSMKDACLLAGLQSEDCKKNHTILEIFLDPSMVPLPEQAHGCLPKVLEFKGFFNFMLSPQQQCTGARRPDQLLHPIGLLRGQE